MSHKGEFAEHWPMLAERLSRYLAQRKIPASLRDDIVQETGLRIFLYWETVDPRRSLWALTRKIAGRVLWASYNDDDRQVSVALVPDRPGNDDVERAVLGKVELERVRAALLNLTEAQRAALLAEIGGRPPSASEAALKMLRMRARRRLEVLLGQTEGLVYAYRLRLRDVWTRISAAGARDPSGDEPLMLAAASGVVMVALVLSSQPLPVVPTAPSEPRSSSPVETTHENPIRDVAVENVPATLAVFPPEFRDATRAAKLRRKKFSKRRRSGYGIEDLYQDATRLAVAQAENAAPATRSVLPVEERLEEQSPVVRSVTTTAEKIVRKRVTIPSLTKTPRSKRRARS